MSRETFDRVQSILAGRFASRTRRSVHDFPFARLVRCGHCGCSLVGEIKKQRYGYYQCTAYKGRCPERYVREDVLAEPFATVLEGLYFDEEIVAWVAAALRTRDDEERRYHDEALARLRAERVRLQQRLDTLYDDRLDGRIDVAFFDRKASALRAGQSRIEQSLANPAAASRSYLDEGAKFLGLAKIAAALDRNRSGAEQRVLLDFLLSNSTRANGALTVTFRQPFDTLAERATLARNEEAAGLASDGLRPEWLRLLDAFRTACVAPKGDAVRVFDGVRAHALGVRAD